MKKTIMMLAILNIVLMLVLGFAAYKAGEANGKLQDLKKIGLISKTTGERIN